MQFKSNIMGVMATLARSPLQVGTSPSHVPSWSHPMAPRPTRRYPKGHRNRAEPCRKGKKVTQPRTHDCASHHLEAVVEGEDAEVGVGDLEGRALHGDAAWGIARPTACNQRDKVEQFPKSMLHADFGKTTGIRS